MSDSKLADLRRLDRGGRRTPSFRKYASAIRPSPEHLRRQNAVLQCAWRSLGEVGSVIAFLNTDNEHLGGRPLHLAIDSDEGLSRVQGLLGEITPRT